MLNPHTFIQDFRHLFAQTPQCGSWTRGSENCDYGDIITMSKDCYMCFNSGNCQEAYYSEDSRALTNSVDCAFSENCELAYECIDCDGCFNSNYCQDCHNCHDIHFSYDLRLCSDCFGCVGLRNKKYYIFNEQYTKENYQNFYKNIDWAKPHLMAEIEGKLEALKRQIPRMYVHQFDTTDCTGDYIYHSKNCHQCFDTRHTQDSAYITQANLDMGTKDCFDCGPIPTNLELCYDVGYSHYLFNCQHLYWCGNLKDSAYSTNCFKAENLFGCHYMNTKYDGFYILNQPVPESDYLKITQEIKAILREKGIHTLADLLYKDVSSEKSPISDQQTARNCSLCHQDFTLIPMEIDFYQKKDILFPIYCPTCRSSQRINLRNPRKMYKRTCDACKNVLITTYPPDSKSIVYCLDCYWKHIK